MSSNAHGSFYSQAELYDIAFSFKEYAAECEFMLQQYMEITGRRATSWLELAAGPARHSLEFSQRGLRAVALDLSESMVNYGDKLAAESGLALEYSQGDMVNFHLDTRVDLAGLMIDSISYILDSESLYKHFACVAEALNHDGLYIIEMAHPKDVLTKESTAKSEWEIIKNGIRVSAQWGKETDKTDTVKQITDVSVEFTAEIDGKKTVFADSAKQRCYTCTEFLALIQAGGYFELVTQYGAMDADIDLYHEKAWRMISILRKKR